MKGFWPLLLLLLAIVGCGDSKTASLEREVDSLKGQVARLKEENAALRDRAIALGLDLDYQKSLNKELQAKLRKPQAAAEPEKRVFASPSKPAAPEEPSSPRVPSEKPPQAKPSVAEAPEGAAPSPAAKPAEPVVPAPKPQTLPDIRPKGAAKKTTLPPPEPPAEMAAEKPETPTEAKVEKPEAPAETKAEKPETPAETKAENAEPPAQPENAKPAKPTTQQEDMYAPFRRPGYKEPAPAREAEAPEQESTKAAAPSSPAPAPEKPRTAQNKPSRISAPPSDLQLVDVTDSRGGNVVHISGFVVNNTDKTIMNVRVKAAFLDDAGAVITSKEYSIEGGSRLDGGDRASFEIASPDSPRIAKYRLIVHGDQSR